MPRGRPAKGQRKDIIQANLPQLEYERLARSMTLVANEELSVKGSEARQRIIEKQSDNLDAIQGLADGILVQQPLVVPTGKGGAGKGGDAGGIVCPNCGEPVHEVVYRVPPYWPALRWLMEWNRQIIREEPAKRVEHSVDPEALEAMRRYIEATDRDVIDIKPNEDGVVNLGDEHAS